MAYGTAVVVGAGIGGLVTARVLADHFDKVVVFDRDDIPDRPAVREGAPQGHHFHAILPGGLEIMNDLFPGFDQNLEARGSLVPREDQFYFFTPEGKSFNLMRFQPEPVKPPDNWPKGHIQTRGLLEYCLRRRLEAVPNVETRYRTMVRSLLTEDKRVSGVVIDGSDERLPADLVIDATGRVSRTLGWLKTLGYETPKESQVTCDFAYTSVFVEPPNADLFTDVGFFIAGDPESQYSRRGGALVRMENGSLLASVGGRLGDHPPRDYEGFMEFAKTLIEPSFYDIVAQCKPLADPHHFKFPRSIRRHYERLEAFPDGLLPVADAICHYNPLYGQGMSAASRQAIGLGRILGERRRTTQSLDGLWRDFFPVAFEQTRAPWLFAALADFNQGGSGDFPDEERSSVAMLAKYNELAASGNARAAELLAAIQSMRLPLSALHETDVDSTIAQS